MFAWLSLHLIRVTLLVASFGVPMSDAMDIAGDIVAATDDPWEQDFDAVWGFGESRHDSNAISADNWTWGAMQVSPATWGDVPELRVEQYQQANAIVRGLLAQCRRDRRIANTRRAALHAYWTGQCSIGEEPRWFAWRCEHMQCDEPKKTSTSRRVGPQQR